MNTGTPASKRVEIAIEAHPPVTGGLATTPDGSRLAVLLLLEDTAQSAVESAVSEYAGRFSELFTDVDLDHIEVRMFALESDNEVRWRIRRKWCEDSTPDETLDRVEDTITTAPIPGVRDWFTDTSAGTEHLKIDSSDFEHHRRHRDE